MPFKIANHGGRYLYVDQNNELKADHDYDLSRTPDDLESKGTAFDLDDKHRLVANHKPVTLATQSSPKSKPTKYGLLLEQVNAEEYVIRTADRRKSHRYVLSGLESLLVEDEPGAMAMFSKLYINYYGKKLQLLLSTENMAQLRDLSVHDEHNSSENSDQYSEDYQRRHRYTPPELEELRTSYAANPRPSRDEKARLAEFCSVSIGQIQIWFQNRRASDRRIGPQQQIPQQPTVVAVRPTTRASSRRAAEILSHEPPGDPSLHDRDGVDDVNG